eukprot:1801471-Prymnesium_polylepis.1
MPSPAGGYHLARLLKDSDRRHRVRGHQRASGSAAMAGTPRPNGRIYVVPLHPTVKGTDSMVYRYHTQR